MTRFEKDHLLFLLFAVITASVVFIVFGFIFWTAYPVLAKEGIGFVTGTTWDYSTGQFGIFKLIVGTLVLTAVTICLAVPLGVMTAVYLAEIASRRTEQTIRPFIELLVGIPSVVYGIFALFLLEKVFQYQIDPFIGSTLGSIIPLFADVNPRSGTSILLASVILTIMVLPTIVAITFDSFKAVPPEFREAALALGATKWETITMIVIPAAMSGIFTACILGIMRAMGETMAVVMLMGNFDKIPTSILDSGYAMTSKILNDIIHHMDEEEARSALFAIGFVLFVMELILVGLARIVNRYIVRQYSGIQQ